MDIRHLEFYRRTRIDFQRSYQQWHGLTNLVISISPFFVERLELIAIPLWRWLKLTIINVFGYLPKVLKHISRGHVH